MTRDASQLALVLADGKAIDHATQPPLVCGGDECRAMESTCTRYQCRYHLHPQDERPGRPHQVGARPPVTLRQDGPRCALALARAEPDGMTTNDIGEALHVVGRRIEQLERRAALKMEGIRIVNEALESLEFPPGIKIAVATAHNDHQLPNHHFVTIALEVDHKAARGPAGVTVRRRRR